MMAGSLIGELIKDFKVKYIQFAGILYHHVNVYANSFHLVAKMFDRPKYL